MRRSRQDGYAWYENILKKQLDNLKKQIQALTDENRMLKEEIKVFEAFRWGKND